MDFVLYLGETKRVTAHDGVTLTTESFDFESGQSTLDMPQTVNPGEVVTANVKLTMPPGKLSDCKVTLSKYKPCTHKMNGHVCLLVIFLNLSKTLKRKNKTNIDKYLFKMVVIKNVSLILICCSCYLEKMCYFFSQY